MRSCVVTHTCVPLRDTHNATRNYTHTHNTDNEVLYLDSSELAAHLRRRFDWQGRRAVHHDPHAALEVPVFVFNLDR